MENSHVPPTRFFIDAVQHQYQAVMKLSRALQHQMLAMNNVIESLRKQALAADQFQVEKLRLLKAFDHQILEIAALGQRVRERNSRVAEQFRRWVQEWQQNKPRRDKEEYEALEKFARIGWYPDPKMPWDAPLRLVKALDEGGKGEVVEAIGEYFRERTDAIETEVEASYPNRKRILHDAFQAHRNGQYNLSILAFLTQADGMWWDKFGSSLFIIRDRENIVRDQISEFQHNFYTFLSELFKTPIPLWISRSEREASLNELNRHQILHGEIVDYGTEQNSLKAISLISWLNWILNETKKKAE